MMMEMYSNQTQTRWDRGEFKAMIRTESSSQPIGFCDGSQAVEDELRETAEQEGAVVEIDKKLLKTGREIWTVRTVGQI